MNNEIGEGRKVKELTGEEGPKRINLEMAQKALAAARQQKIETCWREIDAIVKKHGLVLVATPSISPEGRVVARPRLVDAQGG